LGFLARPGERGQGGAQLLPGLCQGGSSMRVGRQQTVDCLGERVGVTPRGWCVGLWGVPFDREVERRAQAEQVGLVG
jgi:hypothetical protein